MQCVCGGGGQKLPELPPCLYLAPSPHWLMCGEAMQRVAQVSCVSNVCYTQGGGMGQ